MTCMSENTETAAPAPAPSGPRPEVVTPVRFTTELDGYGNIAHADSPQLQAAFARSLMTYFKGRVPVGKQMPHIGLRIQDSLDKTVGTAIAGSVCVYLGASGDEVTRLCDGYLAEESTKAKYPYTSWEIINEESEKRHAAEKAERKAYSAEMLERVAEEKDKRPPPSLTTGIAAGPSKFEPESGSDPNAFL